MPGVHGAQSWPGPACVQGLCPASQWAVVLYCAEECTAGVRDQIHLQAEDMANNSTCMTL